MHKLLSCEAMVTQYFGPTEYAQTNPNYARMPNGLRYHEGLDYVPVDRVSWTLYSPIHGVVKWQGWGNTYGHNLIVFDEESGLSWRWCHLENVFIEKGSQIVPGDILGIGGNTGKSFARHFHLNVVPRAATKLGEFQYETPAFENNGFSGRIDPLGALRAAGVFI